MSHILTRGLLSRSCRTRTLGDERAIANRSSDRIWSEAGRSASRAALGGRYSRTPHVSPRIAQRGAVRLSIDDPICGRGGFASAVGALVSEQADWIIAQAVDGDLPVKVLEQAANEHRRIRVQRPCASLAVDCEDAGGGCFIIGGFNRPSFEWYLLQLAHLL